MILIFFLICPQSDRKKKPDISPRKQKSRIFILPFYYFRFSQPYISLFPSETRVGDVELGEDGNPRSTRVEYFLQRGQRGKKKIIIYQLDCHYIHSLLLYLFMCYHILTATLKNSQSFICAPFFFFFYSIKSCDCNSIVKYNARKLFIFFQGRFSGSVVKCDGLTEHTFFFLQELSKCNMP